MKKSRLLIWTRRILVAAIVVASSVAVGQTAVHALGTRYFDDASSGQQCDFMNATASANWCGNNDRQVRLISGESTTVTKTANQFRAYYKLPADANGNLDTSRFPSGVTLTISHPDFCPYFPGPGGNPPPAGGGNMLDTQANGYYATHSLANGRSITYYYVGKHSSPRLAYIGTKKNSCSQDKVINLRASDFQKPDGQPNGVFFTEFKADHNRDIHGSNAVSACDNNDNNCDGILNSFVLTESGSRDSYVIAQVGTESGGSPGYATTVREQDPKQQTNDNGTNASFKIPFGSDCSVTKPTSASIVLWDLDFNDKTQGQIKLQLDSYAPNGSFATQSQNNVPSRGSANTYFNFTAKPGYKYIFYIKNVNPVLVQQYSTPYDGIYYLHPCDMGWKMDGTSKVTSTVQVCKSVTWTHTATNIGLQDSPKISGNVLWTKGKSGAVSPSQAYSQLFKAGQTLKRTVTYTVPCNTPPNTKLCQDITWDKSSSTDSKAGHSTEGCVTVVAGPAANDRFVNLSPQAYALGGDVEPTVDAQFAGYVSVSGFPGTTDWGYTEQSRQQPALRVTPSSYNTLQQRSRYDSKNASYYYYCGSGYSLSGSTCTRKVGTKTYSYSAYRSYYCGSGYNQSGTTCYRYLYSYKCEYNSSWGPYGTGGPPYCKPYWTCPGGAYGSGYYSSAPTCQGWRCQYSGAPQINQASQPQCDARCLSGYGPDPAPLSYGQYHTYGDRNCYIHPYFSLTCQWLDEDGTPLQSSTVVVGSSGTYCPTQITRPSHYIGEVVCVSYEALPPAGWNTNPPPGTTKHENWRFNVQGPSRACTKVSGKPYVKVYGSDVRVGGGIGKTDTTCSTNTNATLKAWNRSDYAGAGTQYAVMALSNVDGFASAQYNETADQAVGSDPTALTFANTVGAYGYGGNWGSGGAPPCVGYVADLPSTKTELSGSQTIGGTILAAGVTKVVHVTGDVFISGNIMYGPGWTTPATIPQYQLVVEGNIYISSGVTQLDGLYAAVPTNGSNGNIYTCASGIGSPITSAFGQCKTQLVVNGSFAARQVFFLRDCGSLIRSDKSEPTVTTGGIDPEYCSDNNHAAEVFNYSPEQWIRSSAGPTPNVYDAITSMPPIL